MICRRIVAIEKEIMRSLVSIAVHQVGAAWSAIAAGAANLLVVAFEGGGQSGVDYGANIGLVDSHAKSDGGYHDLKLTGLEGGLHTLARLRIEAGMVGGGRNFAACARLPGRRSGDLLSQPLGVFPRGG